MPDALLSVGLDVGTTSTQLIVSKLAIENRAGSFSVPEMDITQREILYRSQVHFTPLLGGDLVDAAAIRGIVDAEYALAGIRREDVDTGAIIITGETSRKENARAVLSQLSGYAGDFVVATAGPDLESVLAAKGAGAVAYSRETGQTVLHMDIGGGTSNLSLIRDGKIIKTGCLNVGGRLLKFKEDGEITYISPVLRNIPGLEMGATQVAGVLVEALEMAAGLRPSGAVLEQLWTKEAIPPADWLSALRPGEGMTISFSGGVADCINTRHPTLAFGDMGPELGQAIRKSLLCAGAYVLGAETIRATVIGAGCHSAQLSGSTVFYRNVDFPMKNLPVRPLGTQPRDGETAVLTVPYVEAPGYVDVLRLAKKIAAEVGNGPVLVCLEQDMAKALGQYLAVQLGSDRSILCIDRVRLGEQSYLDVGAPVGPALPVVVKTLVLER